MLKQHGLSTGVGDEGGFAPDLDNNRAALDLIVEAIGKAGFTPGRDIALAIDAAATEFYGDGGYAFEGKTQVRGRDGRDLRGLGEHLPDRLAGRPAGRRGLGRLARADRGVGDRVQLVGDDLFVTNPERLRRGIAAHTANSLLVKLNQIGTRDRDA